MSQHEQKLRLRELEIVDEHGVVRMRLGTTASNPVIELLDQQGEIACQLSISNEGYPSLQFLSARDHQLEVKLEVDAKGSHLKFDHLEGASSYFFLNNQGSSGLVMLDKNQQRKFAVLVDDQGDLKLEPDALKPEQLKHK